MTEYKYRQRNLERKIRNRRRLIIIGIIALGIILISVGIFFFTKMNKNKQSQEPLPSPTADTAGIIPEGKYIESVAVGGMNYQEAEEALGEYVKSLQSKTITIDINENKLTIPLDRIGFTCDVETFIDQAFIQEDDVIELSFLYDDEAIREFLTNECSEYTVKAKNAKLKRVNGEFVISKSKTGKAVDEDATLHLIKEEVEAQVLTANSIEVVAIIKDDEPKFTSEDMERCNAVLGKFSTSFKESQTDRTSNLRNATSFVDGTVIYPGEIFSVAETIYPLSAANGYKEAPSYAEGQVVDSLGGGVCQVSTTLYNAIILSELEVVERSPHSMVVSYVEPSMDAAIAGDYKDLKFKNNTDTPLYIQGVVSGGIITFTIYGEEVRASNRTIKFESVIVETIQPGKDVVTEDPTQTTEYEKVTQSAHVGYVANLYKVVYEDGVEVDRIKVNYSRYSAEPRYVTVGTKEVEEKEEKPKKDKATAKPKATKVPKPTDVPPEEPIVSGAPEENMTPTPDEILDGVEEIVIE